MEIRLLIRTFSLEPFQFPKLFLGTLILYHFDIQGTLTPLLGIGVCVSIQFGALEYAKRVFAQRNIDHRVASSGADGKLLTPTQLIASGAFAGIANGFVSGPVEHIRIRKPSRCRNVAVEGDPAFGACRTADATRHCAAVQWTLGRDAQDLGTARSCGHLQGPGRDLWARVVWIRQLLPLL